VSKVDAGVDGAEKGYKPMNDVDRDNWNLCEFCLMSVGTRILTDYR
jgi:hypothetical protein